MNKLRKRILELAYKNKLSHIGSALSCVGILDEIYRIRQPYDPVVLSCGHAGLGLYVVLEKYEGQNAQELINFCGVHPKHSAGNGIWCSTGSLGMGITVAVGMALASPDKTVYCVISDGECAEGAVYEAALFTKLNRIKNISLYLNYNGYSALGMVDFPPEIVTRTSRVFDFDIRDLKIPFLTGLDAHYYTMTDDDWDWVQQNMP
jgi:transketolase